MNQLQFFRALVILNGAVPLVMLCWDAYRGHALQYECRSGICGQCRIRLIEGIVQMDCEDALSASEKASGLILACQAWPQSNVVIDA